MQATVELGRSIRTKKDLPLKAPLRECVVIHPDAKVHREIISMKSYIVEELNVRNFTVTADKAKYGIKLKGLLNPIVGARLKSEVKAVQEAVKNLTTDQLESYIKTGEINLVGHTLSGEDLTVVYSVGDSGKASGVGKKQQQKNKQKASASAAIDTSAAASESKEPVYEAQADSKGLLILLDVRPDAELEQERLAREVINRIQRARKKADLVPEDPILVVISTGSKSIPEVVASHASLIDATVKQPIVCNLVVSEAATAARSSLTPEVSLGSLAVTDEASIAPDELVITIFRRSCGSSETSLQSGHADKFASKKKLKPVSLTIKNRRTDESVTICLVDKSGHQLITSIAQLLRLTRCAFGWSCSAGLHFYQASRPTSALTANSTECVLQMRDVYAE